MKVIFYPNEQVLQTYLMVGCEIDLIIANDGETILLSADCCEQTIEDLLKGEGNSPINLSYVYRLKLHKDYAQWNYKCPIFYKQIQNEMERQQEYYKDGFHIISTVLANLNRFVEIRLNK